MRRPFVKKYLWMNRVLVIQTASLGDAIIATALLEKLHGRFPAAETDLLVQKGADALFAGHPYLHTLFVWDKKKQKYAGLHRLIRRIRKRHYDVVVNVQRFAATGWICLRSGAKETVGFDKNPFSRFFSRRIPHEISAENYLYEADRNQRLITHLTDGEAAPTRLYPTDSDEQAVSGYKEQPYLTLSPSSLWGTKQYPKERWIQLIQAADRHYQIYLLGSPKDFPLCEEIRKACPEQLVRNLCGSLSLLQSAALMRDAEMNFTNDSAPLHLAAAVGAEVCAVFCSTVPAFGFAPRGENIRIIETDEPLPCRPCGLHGHKQCPQQHFRCAWSIPIEKLIQYIPPWNEA